MRKCIAALATFLIAQPADAGRVAPGRIASVSVNLTSAGLTIPSNFIGLSTEVMDLVAGYFQGTSGLNGSFLGVASLLGTNGVLRIGGSSSDVNAPTPPAITAQMATNLATFVTAMGSGWSVIYGLDLFANDSAAAATQAGYFASALGTSKIIFQFGNECDGYLSSSAYTTRWNSYYAAVIAAVPGAKTAAADIGNLGRMQSYTSGLTPGASGLSGLTNHWYPYVDGDVFGPAMLVSAPLSTIQSGVYSSNLNYAGSTPLIMVEGNSIAHGGTLGYSDRLVSATWLLNQSIALASTGWKAINLHNAYNSGWQTQAKYNPITLVPSGNFGALPIFSGMVMFSKLGGQQMVQAAVGGNANINTIATKGGNGNANIIVVNNDVYGPVTVNVDQSSNWTTATLLKLEAATGGGCLDATANLGGASIGESGAWSGGTTSIAKGTPISLGPCEAALIQIQP